jgi:hypothetical protein
MIRVIIFGITTACGIGLIVVANNGGVRAAGWIVAVSSAIGTAAAVYAYRHRA